MAQTNLDYSNVRHSGQHRFDDIVLPADCVGNAQYNSADPLSRANQVHQITQRFSQVHGTAATAERRVVHVARGAGVVVGVTAGPVVAAVGDSTVTVDVRKNGTTILSGAVTIDSGDAAYAKLPGAVSDEEYVAGDVFEVVQTVSAGTGTLPQGVFCDVCFEEAAA